MERRQFMLASAAAAFAFTLAGHGQASAASPQRGSGVPQTPGKVVDQVVTTRPRLHLNDWAVIREKIAASSEVASWFDAIKDEADVVLGLPPQGYSIPDGMRLNTAPTLTRSYLLGLVHGVTGEARYADRLWAELSQAAAWKDWNPRHFLDTASMTHAFAIGHDWLFETWSPSQREVLRQAIVTKGLEPGRREHENGAVWTHAKHNWTTVCNSGLTLGALTVADTDPEIAEYIASRALQILPISVEEYGPDGGFPEGVDYWRYSTEYLVVLMSALVSATGSAQGLDDFPGMSNTGLYPISMTGPSDTVFNYYDSVLPSPHSPEQFWLGQRYDNPIFTADGAVRATAHPHPKDVLWVDTDHSDGAARLRRSPLETRWQGIHVAATRSSWSDPMACWAGIKGGFNTAHHGDLDLGTFVLEARGARWANDLGPDDYNLYGYFHMDEGQMRWNYYRKRTEGHNTIVFNPDGRSGYGGQPLSGTGTLQQVSSAVTESFTVLDLDQASTAVSSWRRGLHLFDQRRQWLLRDEFTLEKPGSAWWFWHTDAQVSISSDGRQATLRHGEDALLLRLVGDDLGPDHRFWAAPAVPLWASPNPTQTPNHGVTKLVVWLPEVTGSMIAVQATPLAKGEQPGDLAPAKPLKTWKVGPQPKQLLTGLSVNGEPLPDFVPGVLTYTVVVASGSTPPRVAATAAGQVRVQQASAIPGQAVVTLAGNLRYVVRFETSVGLRPGVVVVASTHDGNVPENTLDANPNTRWSAQGAGQWIRYDLGDVVEIDQVSITFHQGSQRVSMFELQVSDGGAWTTVYQGQSSGTTAGPETISFEPVQARYVRYVGLGNSTNMWNSVVEFAVPGHQLSLPSVPVTLAKVAISGQALTPQGSTVVWSATASDSSGAVRSDATVRWASADPTIATVAADGTVTAHAVGSTVIGAIATTPDGRMTWQGRGLTVHDASEIHLGAVADSYVQGGGSAGSNFGNAQVLIAKTDPVNARQIFTGFGSPDLAGVQIAKAELRMRLEVSDGAGSSTDVTVHAVEGAWTETGLTWNNKPSVGGVLDTQHVNKAADVAFDVTQAVKDALAQGRALDFHVRQVPINGIGRYTAGPSRETGRGPVLVITRA